TDDRHELAGQQAVERLPYRGRGAAVSATGITDDKEQWQGRLFRAGHRSPLSVLLFCCPASGKCAVDGFPPVEHSMPVVVADDPQRRLRHPRAQRVITAEQAEAVRHPGGLLGRLSLADQEAV